MHSEHDDAKDAAKVLSIILDAHSDGVLRRLITNLFRDRCSKCDHPSFVEMHSPLEIELPRLKHGIRLACGYWLARRATAEHLCAEFEGQFDMKWISDDACFLILKNTLIPDDPFYEDAGDLSSVLVVKKKERICSLCGEPYILLNKGFIKFKGGNHIKRRTIYETSLKFGPSFLKYPHYFCDEEAANALRKISRQFRFVESTVKLDVDAV